MNAQAMQAIEGRRDRLNAAMLGTRRLETSGASDGLWNELHPE